MINKYIKYPLDKQFQRTIKKGNEKVKNLFVFASILSVLFFQMGCGSDEDQMEVVPDTEVTEETDSIETSIDVEKTILKDMSEDEVLQLTSESALELVTVVEGSKKTKLKVRFRGVRDFGFGFPLYECELIDPSAETLGGIAQGMSGSPVGPPGRVMGALAYADAFSQAPYRFWATSIDAMREAVDHQTFGEVLDESSAPSAPSAVLNSTYTPVKTPIMITGVQPYRIKQLTEQIKGSRLNFVDLYSHIGSAPTGSATDFSDDLAAGDMIGVAIATGDVVNAVGFGTVTQVYDDKFVAFGHPMFADGKASLPVYRAVVDGIVPNLQISYKSVELSGDPIGTITKDVTPAIVGELGPVPDTIPVTISYHPANLDKPVKKYHEVAYGQESYIGLVAALTQDAIRMESSPGTTHCEVTLKFKETNTDFTRSFWNISTAPFIETYINVDSIVSAFTSRIQNTAGKATLKEVSITITDRPQIGLAEIESINGPSTIKRGSSATFSIVLVPHWSSAGEERTIEKEITLDIPDTFSLGGANLSVSGRSYSSFYGDYFYFDDFDYDDFEDKIPKTLDDLIEKLEDEEQNPSVIEVELEPNNFGIGIEEELHLEGFLVTGSTIKFITVESQ